MKNSLLRIKIIMKTKPNKVQILGENVDKQSQNTHVEVNIFAKSQRLEASRVGIVQNNLHITENLIKQRNLH